MGNANLNPWTQAKVSSKNPDRGPLLMIDGENDHTVPWAIAHAAYKLHDVDDDCRTHSPPRDPAGGVPRAEPMETPVIPRRSLGAGCRSQP
jgi:hypothetical protein